jgi:hypothetical protein
MFEKTAIYTYATFHFMSGDKAEVSGCGYSA